MDWKKFLVVLLFLLMAVGGIGGLMLVGYIVIVYS